MITGEGVTAGTRNLTPHEALVALENPSPEAFEVFKAAIQLEVDYQTLWGTLAPPTPGGVLGAARGTLRRSLAHIAALAPLDLGIKMIQYIKELCPGEPDDPAYHLTDRYRVLNAKIMAPNCLFDGETPLLYAIRSGCDPRFFAALWDAGALMYKAVSPTTWTCDTLILNANGYGPIHLIVFGYVGSSNRGLGLAKYILDNMEAFKLNLFMRAHNLDYGNTPMELALQMENKAAWDLFRQKSESAATVEPMDGQEFRELVEWRDQQENRSYDQD